MTSIYGILHMAGGALLAQQRAIDVTGHNIANANTIGFSRQRVNLETRMPLSFSPGQMGTGVRAAEIQRIYDRLIGVQISTEKQKFGRWEAQKSSLERVEMILDETTGYGLNQAMSEFWNAWQDLSDDPSGWAARVSLLAKSEKLADNFNKIYTDLEQVQRDIDNNIVGPIREINQFTAQIADLNQKIMQIESGGQNANDYRDQRDLLLNGLSALIDINYYENDEGKVSVLVAGGRPLVENNSSWELSTETNSYGFRDIVWLDGDGNSEFLARCSTSSDRSVLNIIADSGAVMGTYSVVVNQLAQAETEEHQGIQNGIFSHSGVLDQTVSINDSGLDKTFKYSYNGVTYTNAVSDGGTLQDLRNSINADASGITASIVTFNGMDHLVLAETAPSGVVKLVIDPENDMTLNGCDSCEDFTEVGFNETINASGADQIFEFTYGTAAPVTTTITVSSGATLEDLRNQINSAGCGVTASIVNDGSGGSGAKHLVLSGDDTGSDNTITITGATTLDGTGNTEDFRNGVFTETTSAQNSQISIDGVPAGPPWNESSNNHIAGAVPGVTIDLVSAGIADITVGANGISGGELRGLLEVRDSSIPEYLNRLDILARGMIDEINAVHTRGFGLDGTTGPANLFFTGSSADDISVNQDIIDDVDLIAAAVSAGGIPGDNLNAIDIANLQNALVMGSDAGTTTFDDFYQSLVSDIGSESQDAAVNLSHESAMVSHLENYREGISGVSLDEEMVNLIKFQHAYEAAAKVITTVDELMATVINMV